MKQRGQSASDELHHVGPHLQASYYITGASKKVAAYENAKLASAFDPQNRDENIDYYIAKLDELVKKFGAVAWRRARCGFRSLCIVA